MTGQKASTSSRAKAKASGDVDQSVPEEPKKTETTTSILTHPLQIDFADPSALARGANGGVHPDNVYRWSHEKNGTLASTMTRAKHNNHRDVPGLMLNEGNAFQSVGTFKPNIDLTPERIQRHLNPRATRDPTPFISTTSSLRDAEKAVLKLHNKSKLAPRCLTITTLDTSRLVPAVLKATMLTTIKTHVPDQKDPISTRTVERYVEMPIWILDKVPHSGNPEDRPSCELEDILQDGGILWLSLTELKESDLSLWASDAHMNEWLAVSSIPESIVTKSRPFDGAILHSEKSTEFVQARGSPEPFYWNFDQKRWEYVPNMTDYRPYREAKAGDKRKLSDENLESAGSSAETESDSGLDLDQSGDSLPCPARTSIGHVGL
ncbi:hypothetical protein ACJQWK_02339 [Exserohilum turcicum]